MTYSRHVQEPQAASPHPTTAEEHPVLLGGLVAVVVMTVLAYIALSLVLAPPDAVDSEGVGLPYNFKSERGSITLLSSGLFCIAAVLAGKAWATVRAAGGRERTLWLAFTLVMIYFSIDEVAQFHEKAGDFLGEHLPKPPFRNYNDVVVIVYGLVALVLAAFLWRTVLRHPRLLPMLVVTGVLYAGTTAVDTFTKDPTPLSEVAEEGIKLCCSTFFALSMLTGLVAVRWLQRSGLVGAGASVPVSAPAGAGVGASGAGVAAVWLTVVGLMAAIGLMVLLIGHATLRLPVNWVAALAAAALVVRAVPWLERGTRSGRD